MHFNIKWTLLFVMLPGVILASESVGKVVFVKGNAQVLRVEPKETKSLSFNDPIFPLDALETKEGEVKILFEDQTVMSLSQNSKVLITEQVYKPRQGVRKSIFDIIKGKVRTIVEKVPGAQDNEVQLQTPTAVAGIRGTDVGVVVDRTGTQFLCFDGLIETYFKGLPEQKVMVETGHQTTIQSTVPTTPESIPTNMQKQFTAQEGPSLKEVLKQSGSEGLNKKEFLPPPPPPSTHQGEAQNNDNPQPRKNNQQNDQRGDQHQPQNQQGQQQALQNNNNPPGPGPQNPPLLPPPPPPLLPGGNTQTPVEFAPTGPAPTGPTGPTAPTGPTGPTAPTTAPVDVPVTFPTPG